MYLLSIILFFLYCWGLGLGISLVAKESEDFLERNLMRLGIGLAGIPALGLLLNLLHIPLDWRIFLLFSMLPMGFVAYRKIKAKEGIFDGIKHPRLNVYVLLMLILFLFTFSMYHKGAFAYPYLEDDDSWGHALATKYVSVEKDVFPGPKKFTYIEPYPPAYDLLMGVMHQTNDSIYWTLKFFNALIISLSIVFFYFFAKILMGSSKKAFFSAFVLAAVPAYLSHFIWALALTMPLFFVSFYCAERIKLDKKWWIVTGVVMVTALTSSPSHSAYFAFFFAIYYICRTIIAKKFLIYETLAGLLGASLSFALWWVPMMVLHGFAGILEGFGIGAYGNKVFDIAGTGDRFYTLNDFVVAKSTNMVNSPIGIGLVVSLLIFLSFIIILYLTFPALSKKWKIALPSISATIGFVLVMMGSFYTGEIFGIERYGNLTGNLFQKVMVLINTQLFLVSLTAIALFLIIALIVSSAALDKRYHFLIIALSWFAFAFYAVNAGPFEIKLSPFRVWPVLAIPIALLAGESIVFIDSFIKSVFKSIIGKNKNIIMLVSLTVLIILSYGIIKTSFAQKYTVNTTSGWPAGGFWTYAQDDQGRVFSPELVGYLWLRDNIPKNSRIFSFSNHAVIIGNDQYVCYWCDDVIDFRRNGINSTPQEVYSWLKGNNFEYLIIDGQTTRRYGVNQTENLLQGLTSNYNLQLVHQQQGYFILFKL